MNSYTYQEIEVGQKESFCVTIDKSMVESFCKITGDINPLHTDENYAKRKNNIGTVVYGMLTASFLSTLAGVYLPGKFSLIHSVEVKFSKPIYVENNTKLDIIGEVVDKNDLFNLLTVKMGMVNCATQEKVCKATMKIGVLSE